MDKGFSREQVDIAVEYLRENPRDWSGAAKLVGVSRHDLFREMKFNPGPFRCVMDEWLDRLESKVMRCGMGEDEDLDEFPFTKAMAILKVARAETWGSNYRARKEAREQKVIEAQATKRGIERDDGEMGKMIERYLSHQFGNVWTREVEIVGDKDEEEGEDVGEDF